MLVNPESMPGWIRWTHWISPFFYAYSSLMINEMSGIKINFEVGAAAWAARGQARPATNSGRWLGAAWLGVGAWERHHLHCLCVISSTAPA
jgi:hypothetical protein